MSAEAAPLLVLAWGNPSRGDDELGPLLAERLEAHAQAALPAGHLEVMTDFQLQVEHALDLIGRERVLLVDAALDLLQPFEVRPLQPTRGASIGSHALAPEALLQVFVDLYGRTPPPTTLLALRASSFDLGTPPSAQALADLELAFDWSCRWLAGQHVTGARPPA